MNKSLNKIILLIMLFLFTVKVTQLKATNYKQEDFYGDWISTAVVQYNCTAIPNNLKLLERAPLVNYDHLLFYNIATINPNQQEDEMNLPVILKEKIIKGNKQIYFSNRIALIANFYSSDPLPEVPPKIKIYNKDKYTKNSHDLGCGKYTVLNIEDEVGSNNFIIINNNKLLLYGNKGMYLVLEKKGTIKKDRKFAMYFYDTEKVRNKELIKKYQKKGFDLHFRPWEPNEDITEVIK